MSHTHGYPPRVVWVSFCIKIQTLRIKLTRVNQVCFDDLCQPDDSNMLTTRVMYYDLITNLDLISQKIARLIIAHPFPEDSMLASCRDIVDTTFCGFGLKYPRHVVSHSRYTVNRLTYCRKTSYARMLHNECDIYCSECKQFTALPRMVRGVRIANLFCQYRA